MRRIYASILVLALLSCFGGHAAEKARAKVNMFGEPESVSRAFEEINGILAGVSSLDITFTSMVHSIQGDVVKSGTVRQEPPYRFNSDVRTYAMDGITRTHEIILANGTNGWELSYSPSGKLVTCSFWTLASMGDIFQTFLAGSSPYLIAPARTNSYENLRYNYVFENVVKNAEGWYFKGHIRHDSELLKSVAKQATAMGSIGFSNFVPLKVSMKISNEGLVTEFLRYALNGRELSAMRLLKAKTNCSIDRSLYYFMPPKDVFICNLDILQELPSMYVKHALVGRKAPDIKVQYLSGKDKIIKPGAKGLTILTFFASWSQLCREYMVVIDRLHTKYAGTGVQFVNVTDQQDQKTLNAYQRGLGTVIYSDAKRESVKDYSVDNIPKTFIIDAKGVVRYVMEGFNTASEVELMKRIDELKEEAAKDQKPAEQAKAEAPAK